jgi:hypothetical protein
MGLRRVLGGCALGIVLGVAAQPALAQSHPEFIPLGRVSAALYKPDQGRGPHHLSGGTPVRQQSQQRRLPRIVKAVSRCLFQHSLRQQRHDRNGEPIALDVKVAVDYAPTVRGSQSDIAGPRGARR